MSVSLITTATCMACTTPFNNTTSSNMNVVSSNNKIYTTKYYSIPIKNKNVVFLQDKHLYDMNNYNYSNYMNKPVSNYRTMKISRKNRKIHNIHQPGRTNCTQRYQK